MKRPALFLTICWICAGLASAWLVTGLLQERARLDREATDRVMALARLVGRHVGSMMDATELILATSSDELDGRVPEVSDRPAVAEAHAVLKTAVGRTSAVRPTPY